MIRIPQRRSMLKSSGLVAAIAIFAGAVISPWSIVEASTIYECTDESGEVTLSDHPCGGGKAVKLRPCGQESQEQSRDEARRKALQHQEEVSVRLSIDRLEREKDRLEAQRRSLIRERDSRAARLAEPLAEAHDAAEANFWQKRLNETHIAYERQIRTIEETIFDKQLELQQLLTAHDVPHVRATTRVLDRGSWGKCSLYIEGEETAMSLRVRGDGFAQDTRLCARIEHQLHGPASVPFFDRQAGAGRAVEVPAQLPDQRRDQRKIPPVDHIGK